MHVVRNYALLPGSAPFWESGWAGVPRTPVFADDVIAW